MQSVDIVIAWVDGSDPILSKKREAFVESNDSKGADPTRFANFEEIYYCLRSIRKNAPWVNQIYIVTDDQIPRSLTTLREEDPEFATRICVVDHKEIFEGYLEFLPTFNSISIGSLLWRIVGLSERFIYFNDDVFLCSMTEEEDFFHDFQPRYRGRWIGAWYSAIWYIKNIAWRIQRKPVGSRRPSFKDAQFLASKKAVGRSIFFAMGHTPHPARVSTFKMMFSENEYLWRGNLIDRFRSYKQFSAFAAARSFDLLRGRAVATNDLSLVFLRGESDSEARVIEKCRMMESGDYLFGCVNGLDKLSEELRNKVLGTVEKIVS